MLLAIKILLLLMTSLATTDLRVLFFTMQGCPPCRQTEPNIDRLAHEGIAVSKIDTRQQPNVAAQFNVSLTPTIVLTDGSQVLDRHTGPMTYRDLRAMIDSASPRSTPLRMNQPTPRSHVEYTNAANQALSDPSHLTPENRAMQATVRLRVEDDQGTSFATGTVIHRFNQEALVLTCGHVFRDSQGRGAIRADIGFGAAQPTTVIGKLVHYEAGPHDIALVAIPCNLPIEPVSIAPEAMSIQTGDRVFSLGCDRGAPPSVRPSAVKVVSRYSGVNKYDIVGRPVDGRSGGGLFTLGGQLIGVCNAAAVEVDEGIYTGLHSIYWQFAKTNLTHLFKSRRNMEQSQNASALVQNGLNHDRWHSDQSATNSLPAAPLNASTNSRAGGQPLTGIERQATRGADSIRPAFAPAGHSSPISNVSNPQFPGEPPSDGDLEIIVLLRSKTDPRQVQAITVENPSRDMLQLIRQNRSLNQRAIPDRMARNPQMPDLDAAKMLDGGHQMRAQSPR